MRLWHWELIPYLPNLMILAQWRELCAIAKNIQEKGTPGHKLVNPVMDYPWWEFHLYASKIKAECIRRGFDISSSESKFDHILEDIKTKFDNDKPDTEFLFRNWHTSRYLTQNYYNLEEKFDRGIITEKEWQEFSHCIPVILNDMTVPF